MDWRRGVWWPTPIPEEDEIAPEIINPIIEQALADAEAQHMTHGAVTPFVLQRVYELTEGASLAANITLVLNNARLAAKIAAEIAKQSDIT